MDMGLDVDVTRRDCRAYGAHYGAGSFLRMIGLVGPNLMKSFTATLVKMLHRFTD